MHGVFYVAITLLKKHEAKILNLNSFEEIIEYFKTTLPNIPITESSDFFEEVTYIAYNYL